MPESTARIALGLLLGVIGVLGAMCLGIMRMESSFEYSLLIADVVVGAIIMLALLLNRQSLRGSNNWQRTAMAIGAGLVVALGLIFWHISVARVRGIR